MQRQIQLPGMFADFWTWHGTYLPRWMGLFAEIVATALVVGETETGYLRWRELQRALLKLAMGEELARTLLAVVLPASLPIADPDSPASAPGNFAGARDSDSAFRQAAKGKQEAGGYRSFADQLLGAAGRTVLLIAEGANRYGSGSRRQRYSEARGACGEVAAAVELLSAMERVPSGAANEILSLAGRVAAMLTRLLSPASASAQGRSRIEHLTTNPRLFACHTPKNPKLPTAKPRLRVPSARACARAPMALDDYGPGHGTGRRP